MAVDFGAAQRHQSPLRVEDLDPNPIRQFLLWYEQAKSAGLALPEAMSLATATPDGKPSARMVLLRGCDERGFVFYTNYDSRKGRELAANPWAALVFYWAALERQVRVEGLAECVAPEESDAYFRTRPRESQLGAWASPQSQVIADRHILDTRFGQIQARHVAGEVPRPPTWGGWRVIPEMIEFWQAQPGRLHDRLRFRRAQPAGWLVERLAP